MRAMIDGTGTAIDLVPDGETGDRRCWVRDELIALEAEHPAVGVDDRIGSANIGCRASLRVRPEHEAQFTPASLGQLGAFDYLGQATRSRAVLDELESRYDREFTLQQGLPHYVDLAFLAFCRDFSELTGALPYGEVFADHLHRQIHAIIAEIGADTVLFQIESPHALMDPLRRGVAPSCDTDEPLVGETVALVINRATPQACFGVHLCLGDGYGEAAVPRLPTTAPIVTAIEAISLTLERPEALEYVHFSLAAGRNPPPADPGLYRPLAALRQVLPEETRIVAGLAHERQSFAEQVRVLDSVETAIGEPVDIATACGLGCRSPGVAAHVVRRMMELVSV